jgi:4-hydroxybenzoate polyprenyltransferase
MPFLQLIRYKNLLIIILIQALVYQGLHPVYCLDRPFSVEFMLLVLATVLISAAGYIINDYFDVKIDAVNKPDKIVVTKFLKPRWAIVLHVVFNTIAIVIGVYISWQLVLVFLFITLLLWQYSASWKKMFLLGNLTIALLMSSTVLVLWVWDAGHDLESILFYSFFAFFTGFLREIIKDLEDLKGDETYDCKTIPIVWGVAATRKFLYILSSFLGALLGVAIFFFFFREYTVYGFYLLLLVLFPFMGFIHLLRKADRKKNFSRLSTFIKLIMLAGVLSIPVFCFNVN